MQKYTCTETLSTAFSLWVHARTHTHARTRTRSLRHAHAHTHTHSWQTVKTEGPTALYRGFLPAYLRLGPWNIIVSSHCCCCFVYGMLEIIHTFVFLTITLVLCHLWEVKTDILKRKWERDHLGPISLDILYHPSFISIYLQQHLFVCLFVYQHQLILFCFVCGSFYCQVSIKLQL